MSESDELFRYYKKNAFGDVRPKQFICWSCLYEETAQFLRDEINFEELIRIRKEYNKTWAPDYAMVNTCIKCGDWGIPAYSYDKIPINFKKCYHSQLKK